MSSTTPAIVLTVAGSDSGGGAGIQADLKTIQALGGYGMSVITAITAQNTLGVQAVEGVSPEMVYAQVESVLSDIGAGAIKTGMMFSEPVIAAFIKALAARYTLESHPPIVIDPVCVSTSGHTLLPLSAIATLTKDLIPWGSIITPNIPEGELLAGMEKGSINSLESMRECAKIIGDFGCRWVLLKGGHRPEERADGTRISIDMLWDSLEQKEIVAERKYIETTSTHGTGCTLSAAIATGLARGLSVPEAVSLASNYVYSAIASAFPLGGGSGPVNHSHNLHERILPLPTKSSPNPFTDLLIAANPKSWAAYVNHPFPNGLAAGTLPLSSFLYFLKQDYHFLVHYARTYALAAYKTEDLDDIAKSTTVIASVIHETKNHIAYCAKYGITRAELLAVPESTVNIAYNRYVLDTGSRGNLLDLRVATAPCLIGYGVVGKRLLSATTTVDQTESNPYWAWVAEYGGKEFQDIVDIGIELLESTVAQSPISTARFEELSKIFVQTTELEVAFWDDAMKH